MMVEVCLNFCCNSTSVTAYTSVCSTSSQLAWLHWDQWKIKLNLIEKKFFFSRWPLSSPSDTSWRSSRFWLHQCFIHQCKKLWVFLIITRLTIGFKRLEKKFFKDQADSLKCILMFTCHHHQNFPMQKSEHKYIHHVRSEWILYWAYSDN